VQETDLRLPVESSDEPKKIKKEKQIVPFDVPKTTKKPFIKKTFSITISGLSQDINKKQLYKKVRKYGSVKEINFPLLEDSTQAQVIYETEKDAENAIKHLHEHQFKGMMLAATMKEVRILLRGIHCSLLIGVVPHKGH
jgi:nucleolar protein 4